ncbi:MAG: NAD-dependent epimerase/dehydratase family protein [Actinobacteria bacterium]|nr:NAD-dependent epimerase/dehydratase family protein [Actinomycetota bacterium]
MAVKKVLLTGASGTMGAEAFHELLRRKDRYETRLLLRPSRTNTANFKNFEKVDGVEIVWGDLTNRSDVFKAVRNVDFILHPAAIIPPAANDLPGLATEVNVEGTRNLVDAVKAHSGEGTTRFVNIGTVVEYGERQPHNKLITASDPVGKGVCDHYGRTKVEGEKIVINSGLRYWVSLRQTYIAAPDILGKMNPLMFQQPLDQHIEIITARDAGFGLVQCLETPEEFWGKVYNMAGGPSCRTVFVDYLDRLLRIYGIGDYRKIMERNWFALRQHRCGWFEDSDILDGYLHHWRESLEDHFDQVRKNTHWYVKCMGGVTPRRIVKLFLKRMAYPIKWIEEDDREGIEYCFGSRENWESISGWN